MRIWLSNPTFVCRLSEPGEARMNEPEPCGTWGKSSADSIKIRYESASVIGAERRWPSQQRTFRTAATSPTTTFPALRVPRLRGIVGIQTARSKAA